MSFVTRQAKGLQRLFLEEGLPEGALRLHISEVAPGMRAHPPHAHSGVEAFYLLEGSATLEIDDERLSLCANEAVIFDPRKLHGLVNTGDRPLRYMVIITQ